ncbi:MAG: folate-binding protein [Pseudomonadota bacterium]
MFNAFLSQRGLISIGGEDSLEFLQGLVSNDVRQLADGKPVYAALLSPQGRFLHDFFLIPWNGKIFVDVKRDRVGDLFSRLKIYRLRSKVEIAVEESFSVCALWAGVTEENENPDYNIYVDPRLPELGFRAIGRKDAIAEFCQQKSISPVVVEEYEYFRLSLCVPDTSDMVVEKSLLLESGFEELHGVDFSKGCYIGQEVTARSKFRGQVRKSFYSVKADENLPVSGSKIMVGDEVIGEMRTSLKDIGIALIYNDKYAIAKDADTPFVGDGVKLEILPASWTKKA